MELSRWVKNSGTQSKSIAPEMSCRNQWTMETNNTTLVTRQRYEIKRKWESNANHRDECIRRREPKWRCEKCVWTAKGQGGRYSLWVYLFVRQPRDSHCWKPHVTRRLLSEDFHLSAIRWITTCAIPKATWRRVRCSFSKQLNEQGHQVMERGQ